MKRRLRKPKLPTTGTLRKIQLQQKASSMNLTKQSNKLELSRTEPRRT